jgi:cysteine synthase/rhodanese-related sulfurtransferase
MSRFRKEIEDQVPRREAAVGVVHPTPLSEVTQALVECARVEFGLDISSKGAQVFGKFDSKIHGGSVKVRPAVRILSEAIATGKLTRGMTVFEATSGNFGLALGMLKGMDVRVVALVSRRIQDGISQRLEDEGISVVNLDVDICPVPGGQSDIDAALARAIASGVRQQLAEAGLDPSKFDSVRAEAESVLARQDAIGLAKLLAKAYHGFCPEQYDNLLNAKAHEEVTGPEIDQQLRELGLSFGDFDVVCAFGTGGTAAGLSSYAQSTCGRRSVRVVYPLAGQDVAGIRTRERATSLSFYDPKAYAGEHETDFDKARRLLRFFNERGYDVGESGVLVLYACIELVNYGAAKRLVALIADGGSRYAVSDRPSALGGREVTLQEATAQKQSYAAVVWTHGAFVPREEGVHAIASSIGVEVENVRVAKAKDVRALISGSGVPKVFALPGTKQKLLLVCVAGGTSRMAAKELAKKGVTAESLIGGIAAIPSMSGRNPLDYLQQAKE